MPDPINIPKLFVHQNNTALIKDLLPIAIQVNTLSKPEAPSPPAPSPTPLICSADMIIPPYFSAIVNEYFFIPSIYTLTIQTGAIFNIL